MLKSIALIFLFGLSFASICQQLHLPRIIGMLIAGILLGPYMFNWFDPSILSISAPLRHLRPVGLPRPFFSIQGRIFSPSLFTSTKAQSFAVEAPKLTVRSPQGSGSPLV